jgi:hypothetical protein
MKKFVYQGFEYLLNSERARTVLFWVSFGGMLACAWELPLARYIGVILFGGLVNLHGLIDGAATWGKYK